jgi:DNA-binding MarR family transcriptional regulator
VRLTPKGAAQLAVIAKAHEGWIDELLAGFGPEEMEALIEHLGELAAVGRKEEVQS